MGSADRDAMSFPVMTSAHEASGRDITENLEFEL
jgi:hypothetical protein